jgi:hypothetical protein
MRGKAQSYMGKNPLLKGIGGLYGSLRCVFRARRFVFATSWPKPLSMDPITLPERCRSGDMARIAQRE